MTVIQKRRFYVFIIPAAVLWAGITVFFTVVFGISEFWYIPLLVSVMVAWSVFGSALVLAMPRVAVDELNLYMGKRVIPLSEIQCFFIRKRATRYSSVDQWQVRLKTDERHDMKVSYKSERRLAELSSSLGIPVQRS